jgi:hypothetical protein
MKLYLPWWPSGWLSPTSSEHLIFKALLHFRLSQYQPHSRSQWTSNPNLFYQVGAIRPIPPKGSHIWHQSTAAWKQLLLHLNVRPPTNFDEWLASPFWWNAEVDTIGPAFSKRTSLPPYIVLVWSVCRMYGAIYSNDVSQVTWRLNVPTSRPLSSLHGIVFAFNSQALDIVFNNEPALTLRMVIGSAFMPIPLTPFHPLSSSRGIFLMYS